MWLRFKVRPFTGAHAIPGLPLLVWACYTAALIGTCLLWAPLPGAVRLLPVTAAVVICPGLALTSWLEERDSRVQLALSPGLGTAVVVIVALAMVLTQWWHPRTALTAIIAASVALMALNPSSRPGGRGAVINRPADPT